jgi:hypothetical protein
MPFKYNALLGLGLDNTIPLDGAGKIPSTFLPSYVDDVEEYNNLAAFPATGETGKIYVAIDTGFVYRWSGSVYVQIGITAAAGATTQVQFNDAGAFGGDSGLTFNKTTDALSAGGFIPTSSTVPANGIYLPAANSVAVATNGTGRVFIDASGNVGIGASPSSLLWVSGGAATATISSSTNTSNLDIKNNTQTTRLGAVNADFAIAHAGSERLRITSAGLVGIGTSAPSAALDVRATSFTPANTGSALLLEDRTTNSQALHFYLNNAGVNFSGKPSGGIGAVNSGQLRIAGGGIITDNYAQGVTNFTPSSTEAGAISVGGAIRFFTKASLTAGVGTDMAGSERMRIDSSGRVGIGTTDPGAYNDAAENLVIAGGANTGVSIVSGSATGASRIYFARGTSAVGSDDRKGQINYLHTDDALQLVTAASERARIDSSGRLLVGTSTARANFLNSTSSPNVQIEGAGADGGSLALVTSFNSGNSSTRTSVLQLGRAGSTSLGSNTIVAANNFLGSVIFSGNDGSEFVSAASIDGQVDGTPGANDMPGRLVFSVTADGAASPTEALRISNDRSITVSDGGNVVLGTTTGTKIGTATTQKLGFYNATPVVQPIAVADATDAATAITQLNDLLAKLRTLGIIAT